VLNAGIRVGSILDCSVLRRHRNHLPFATLVVLFFMRVKGASEKLTGAVVVSGFLFLAILLTLSLADYLTRSWR